MMAFINIKHTRKFSMFGVLAILGNIIFLQFKSKTLTIRKKTVSIALAQKIKCLLLLLTPTLNCFQTIIISIRTIQISISKNVFVVSNPIYN